MNILPKRRDTISFKSHASDCASSAFRYVCSEKKIMDNSLTNCYASAVMHICHSIDANSLPKFTKNIHTHTRINRENTLAIIIVHAIYDSHDIRFNIILLKLIFTFTHTLSIYFQRGKNVDDYRIIA